MTKVILGADSIHPPLTGIGRYAYELARRLPHCQSIESIRLYSLGRWVDPRSLESFVENTSQKNSSKLTLRLVLSRNRLAVRLFSSLMPIWSSWRMKSEGDAVFHSPNFFLPPFPGATVATIHDLSHVVCPQFHPQARVDFLNREMPKSLQRANILLTDAESVRQEVITQYSWPADRVFSIPLGADEIFHPRNAIDTQSITGKYGLTHGGYSLYVGTIEPRKNIARLIKAYSMLPERLRVEFPLVLAGGKGWQADDIHDLMYSAANAGWLKYLGYVPEHELPFLYSGAKLFCFPSLYEGFGLPPLEAMASGVPVLTSSTSSLPEVVGNVGIKIQPEDTDSIESGLRSGLEDALWQERTRSEGIKRAAEFSWQRCAERTAELYGAIRPSK